MVLNYAGYIIYLISRDKFGDSQEMLNYLNKNKSEEAHRQKSNQLRYVNSSVIFFLYWMHYFRQLCLDALVEEGDRNFDWRLSFDEFKDLLSDTFVPSTKGNWLKLKLYCISSLPSNFLTLFILHYFSRKLFDVRNILRFYQQSS